MLGDRWSLLIIRDMMVRGYRTFKQFLSSDEHIATNILADRLAKLEIAGIINRVNDPKDGRRVLYGLTEKGLALAPVLAEMSRWGMTWEDTAAPDEVVRRVKSDPESFVDQVIKGWQAGTLRMIKLEK